MEKRTIESNYQSDLMARATMQFPSVRMFRRNVGLVRMQDGRMFRTGTPGMADIYAIDRSGRHYEIEIKNVRTPVTEAQEAWRTWCVEWNIPWILLRVRAGEVPVETVARWMGELRAFFGV